MIALAEGPAEVHGPPDLADARSIAPPDMRAVARSMARLHGLLATARVVWLSTLRPDGRPHVVPVWFDWDGETITVLTRPDAQKVRNVRHESRVMLAVGSAERFFDVELLEGEASLSTDTGLLCRCGQRLQAKYGDALGEDDAPVAFHERFACAMRIRPTRLLDWGMRSARPSAVGSQPA